MSEEGAPPATDRSGMAQPGVVELETLQAILR